MVQAPTATIVTVLPLTEQTDVVREMNVTGNTDDAVALKAKGAAPHTLLPNAPKLMV